LLSDYFAVYELFKLVLIFNSVTALSFPFSPTSSTGPTHEGAARLAGAFLDQLQRRLLQLIVKMKKFLAEADAAGVVVVLTK
jgi:hypothetical protein